MKKRVPYFIATLLLFAGFKADALEKYAGDFQMVLMKFNVTVESWGEHCGPKPSSYQSKKVVPVKITSRGKHLVFSKGGVRTDRCGSPNPRLQTQSATATDGKWIRVCQTARSDSKFERGKYTLVAKGEDRLEYTAESKFDWTLKNDHCIAKSTEKRVYVRTHSSDKREEDPSPKKEAVQPGCENPGPTKRILVEPRKMELGPSEHKCFRTMSVDANGCKTIVKPKWSVTQSGQIVRGLITPLGCFVAGDTAAESEGLYNVSAKYLGKMDNVEVLVSFPDITELLAARLRPLDEIAPDESSDVPSSPSNEFEPKTTQTDGGQPTPPGPKPILVKQAPLEGGTTTTTWIVIICIAAVFIGMVAWGWVWIRRRTATRRSGAEFGDWLDTVDRDRISEFEVPDSESSPPKNAPEIIVENRKVCPKCQRAFEMDSGFCPDDGTSLVVVESTRGDLPRSSQIVAEDGKICPSCHRGYDTSARFCPHDSEPLVLYSEWRSKRNES